jgi:hypothetical protein
MNQKAICSRLEWNEEEWKRGLSAIRHFVLDNFVLLLGARTCSAV